jgi:hypothetical protein
MNAVIVCPSWLLLCWAEASLFFLQDMILTAVAAINARAGKDDFFILGVLVSWFLFTIRESYW